MLLTKEMQHSAQVDRVAASLAALGVTRGARVAVWGPNTPEYLLTQFACYRLGAICVMLNPAWRMQELQRALSIVCVFFFSFWNNSDSQLLSQMIFFELFLFICSIFFVFYC